MKNEQSIVLVGDSPATYMCAIYIFTANIRPLILRKRSGIEYSCSFVPGVDASKEEYDQKCYEQAKNMGIDVIDCESVDIAEVGEQYSINYGTGTVKADVLVLETNTPSLSADRKGKSLFVVEDTLQERESIVLAGEGCKIAFAVKSLRH